MLVFFINPLSTNVYRSRVNVNSFKTNPTRVPMSVIINVILCNGGDDVVVQTVFGVIHLVLWVYSSYSELISFNGYTTTRYRLSLLHHHNPRPTHLALRRPPLRSFACSAEVGFMRV